MANLYLFEPDGNGVVQCTGAVDSATCTWVGGGYFVTAGSTLKLYHLDGTTVTFIRTISSTNYGGVASIHEKVTNEKEFQSGKIACGRLYTA